MTILTTNANQHWVIADPTSQRFTDYCVAAESSGLPRPICVDWIDLIEHGTDILDDISVNARLRIDSFGQRGEVIAALIRHGAGTLVPRDGEIQSLDAQYAGLCRVLRAIADWSTRRTDVRLDQDPREVAVMFDKWASHHRVVPDRPNTILLPSEPRELNETLLPFVDECGGRVFVKPRYASSASGVGCYRVSGHRQQLIAPIEIVRDSEGVRLFNSLRVRSFTDARDIQDIFSVLIPQGMIAEAAVNKARVYGDRFDLRIVVVSGQADHVVVRQSPSPITNLHLGNRRGSLNSVRDVVGTRRLRDCQELALHAASQFPRTLYCGVDILVPRRGKPLVCEVNAFGDFLPNFVVGGKTVYQAIVQARPLPEEAAF
ncbi:STM4014 family protein [Allorhodopirellula heiligendammensis]|uniref:Uncharacterized protein n=1 Tax=Allorhodopirellula heiligendammensis TaxID=2714739 RepID=A0A5C6BZZ9_9BACT|nr:STM4014 family protein [Allorhodopirellula heiligendammensis]TWU17853.1 hypothetical protein Poly21_00040 [Allorhodopirellula heiligendammensis]